jgi:hypothetical protein
MREDQKSYFRQRAVEELAAARRATCVEAATVHQALADSYSAMVADEVAAAQLPIAAPELQLSA